MSTPESRAATSAAIGALTDFLAEVEAGSPRPVGAYLQQLVDEDGVGVLAQGYYGLLDLSALLLPMAAAGEGLTPEELLRRIALLVARDPDVGRGSGPGGPGPGGSGPGGSGPGG